MSSKGLYLTSKVEFHGRLSIGHVSDSFQIFVIAAPALPVSFFSPPFSPVSVFDTSRIYKSILFTVQIIYVSTIDYLERKKISET